MDNIPQNPSSAKKTTFFVIAVLIVLVLGYWLLSKKSDMPNLGQQPAGQQSDAEVEDQEEQPILK